MALQKFDEASTTQTPRQIVLTMCELAFKRSQDQLKEVEMPTMVQFWSVSWIKWLIEETIIMNVSYCCCN